MNKNLKYIFIIFLLLVAMTAWNIYSPQLFPASSPYRDSIKNLSKQNIHIINITKAKKSVEIQKKQNKWQVNGKPADTAKVEELLSALFPPTPPDLVSQSDKKHKEFELTADLAVKVKLNNQQTILLGKITYPNIYACFDNQKEVYLLKNPSTLSTNLSDWLEIPKQPSKP